ncbi:GTPase activating protein for RHO [Scheffersomyces xylosifermentans]|uniref:GTPase activating protein for RHO n=1 Tax=Scheffersomyces xylosifermentans TaxID=1304137 RepID=UPI00315CACBE
MSHSSSPTNRSTIFGWVKSLKRGNLLSNDSVNEITSDNELATQDSRSPTKAKNINLSLSQSSSSIPGHNSINNPQSSPPNNGSHQDFLRPLLHHKSRSTNNVNRVRSNSNNISDKSNSLRQHRDSFLQHNPLVDENSKYFGVPLETAISEASAKISILNPDPSDHSLSYGFIPIVVAKCGVYLKNNGFTVEGIFRVGGSSKRLKELQVIFNSPPDYGKSLNWDGYTVHDAASILRRYLNALPEPLIPLDLYEAFRDPLRQRSRIISYMKYKAENPNKSLKSSSKDTSSQNALLDTSSQPLTEANIGRLNSSGHLNSGLASSSKNTTTVLTEVPIPSSANATSATITQSESTNANTTVGSSSKNSKNYRKLTRDVHEAIEEYKLLMEELPTASRQLLFYILDLLAMVQNHSAENLMSSRNLAAIFQPSILSHPNHDMDPEEYALSQLVVEFLVQYAYKLLPKQTPPSGKASPDSVRESVKSNSNLNFDQTGASVVTPEPLKGQDVHSTITSTSTTPIEEASGLLAKPTKRTHSKSLSSPESNDDHLVGYENNIKSKSIPIVDPENDFEITDDDIGSSDGDDLQAQLKLNNGSSGIVSPQPVVPLPEQSVKPNIVVSTPGKE